MSEVCDRQNILQWARDVSSTSLTAKLVSAGKVCLSPYSNMREVRLTGAQVRFYFVLLCVSKDALKCIWATLYFSSYAIVIKQLVSNSAVNCFYCCHDPHKQTMRKRRKTSVSVNIPPMHRRSFSSPFRPLFRYSQGQHLPWDSFQHRCWAPVPLHLQAPVYWDVSTSGKWKENVSNPLWIWKAPSETNNYYPESKIIQ